MFTSQGREFWLKYVLPSQNEPRIFVESEDEPDRVLLDTKITKDDEFQKQGSVFLPCLILQASLLHRD